MAGSRSTNLQCLVQTKKAAMVADVEKAVAWRSFEVRDGIACARGQLSTWVRAMEGCDSTERGGRAGG